jgi:hypothetical protein
MGSNVSLINRKLSVRGLSLDGGKGVTGLLEEERDRVGCHGCLGGFFGSRAKAVEGCNDDDQREGVGSGKLREFGAFGDTSKSVVAAMATAAFEAFWVSSSNLTSIACGNGGPNCYNIGMKKSGIDCN